MDPAKCPSTVALRALIRFRSRNEQFSASFKNIKELRGGILVYAAQAIPPIDAEIAEKGHLWTETTYPEAFLPQPLQNKINTCIESHLGISLSLNWR